ncbi:M20 family metallo-hydrolase [Sporosarcina highlanderae]|uniref:M20 family metallo-hydrolase n=1 Tax=Sporosarcina highlanderae TaxID=3035916 RepID=A0ABT8JXU9_9BACL|nr:M20 family metallo-hydrolase [Sporosarcina highlanderae]MDN4609182.1 M20 family metallo-hydrolase [Sporosarcina highlanderae]
MNDTKLNPAINLERLKSTFDVSSSIGATEGGGITRLALTKEDIEIRDVFVKWLKEANLSVKYDDLGNIYGRREGKNKDAKSIMIGSHLDTLPKGGRFDGIMGVLTSLEVIRTLNDLNIETERPIEIVNFTNEEGERFTPPMQGSGVVTGNYDKTEIYNLRDKDGITFEQSLKESGYMGEIENRPSNVDYFIETHIEQGPFLEENQKSIGIVQGVKGSKRHRVIVKGKSSHGAFPNSHRKDALMAASEIALAIDETAKSYKDLSTSLGVFDVKPSVESITAESVEFTFDVRHIDDHTKDEAIEVIKSKINEVASRRKVEVDFRQTWVASGTYFSKEILDEIEKSVNSLSYSYQYITAPALHDAKFMQDITNTAMIFAPSKDGLSHCEEEYTSYEDIEKVANVLLQTVISLSK